MCLRRRHFSQRVAFVLAARQDLLGHSSTLNAKSPPATAPPRRPRSRASGNPSVGLEPRNAARFLVVYLSSPVRPGELSALGQPLNVQKLPGRRRSRGLPGFSQCPNANGARRSTRSQKPMDIEMRSLGDGGRGLRVVVIAPPLRNGGFAALGAREAPNDEARVHETSPAGPS